MVKAVISISESLWHVGNVRLTAMNSNWNAVQVIFSECLVSPDELLVSNLSASSCITPAFSRVDNHVSEVLIVDIAARKND
jgi:hypothetical protein